MTFRCEWLYFHETTNETVNLGNNTMCEVKDYRSVAIKMLINGK